MSYDAALRCPPEFLRDPASICSCPCCWLGRCPWWAASRPGFPVVVGLVLGVWSCWDRLGSPRWSRTVPGSAASRGSPGWRMTTSSPSATTRPSTARRASTACACGPRAKPDRAGRRIRVDVAGWTAVRGADGGLLEPLGADLEEIAALPDGEILVASEGWGERLIPPSLVRLGADGTWRGELVLPDGFAPTADGRRGVRSNLAFESLTVTGDGRYLFTATENALAQDGPTSDFGVSSPSRLLRYDLSAASLGRSVALSGRPAALPAAAGDGTGCRPRGSRSDRQPPTCSRSSALSTEAGATTSASSSSPSTGPKRSPPATRSPTGPLPGLCASGFSSI